MSDVIGTIDATPDASLATSIGLHHTLVTAVADLIDNSIDAGAKHVLVRFLQRGTLVTGLRVIDDGAGMDSAAIDSAMTYGSRRHYDSADLGHFGVGMKAASLSQASALVVWSHAEGSEPQGRTIDREDPHAVSIIKGARAALEMSEARPRFPLRTGTIVEWQDITTFSRSADEEERTGWLEQAIGDIRDHLAIVFHRLLGDELAITVDVFDLDDNQTGALRKVKAIDPFDYPISGDPTFPLRSSIDVPGSSAEVTLHIWPARSSSAEFRLYGAPGRDRQGFYFYRAGRLLQVGGWNGLVRPRADYGLARVSVDLDDALMRHITINPEKFGVTLDASAAVALEGILATVGYFDQAVHTVTTARSRQSRPVSVVAPEAGFPEDLLDAFSDAFTFDDGDPVRVAWRVLARDKFFEVDLQSRALWINGRFRKELLGRRSYDNTDAPLIKALLYLLTQQMFQGTRHSHKQIEQMQAWQDVLVAAVTARRIQKTGDSR